MYAVVRQLKIKDAFRDENQQRVHDDLLPRFKNIPGFVDCYLIYCEDGIEISIGLFQNKAGADAMQAISNAFVKDFAQNVKLSAVNEGEVVVQGRTPSPA